MRAPSWKVLSQALGVASVFAVSSASAQEVIHLGQRGGHHAHHEASCPEPQRIVVTLPPPRVEVHDKCDTDSDRGQRHSLFGRKHHQHKSHHAAGGVEMMYAPATLPAMMINAAPAVQSQSFTQQITYDFSALRQAQEMEIRAAALAAQVGARNAMIQAENDNLQRMMDRAKGAMQAMSSACQNPATGDKEGKVNLEDTLTNMSKRLDRIEELVLEHHAWIKSQQKPK